MALKGGKALCERDSPNLNIPVIVIVRHWRSDIEKGGGPTSVAKSACDPESKASGGLPSHVAKG